MAVSVGTRGTFRHDINVTPLVDVLLVLLIIFMVALPTLREGFEGKLPRPDPTGKPSQTVVLQIGPGGELSLNKAAVAEKELGDRLGAIYSARHEKLLFVKVDEATSYGYLIRILDICRSKGRVEQIGFIMGTTVSRG
jgi:biopolymer transport protein ExbD